MTESKPLVPDESSLQRQFTRAEDAFPKIPFQIILGYFLKGQKGIAHVSNEFPVKTKKWEGQTGCDYLVISDG